MSTTRLSYTYRRYSFGDELTTSVLDGRTSQSHLVTFGWTRRLGERTSMTLQLGPRLSEDVVNINASENIELSTGNAIGADALASINYKKTRRASLSLTRGMRARFSRAPVWSTPTAWF